MATETDPACCLLSPKDFRVPSATILVVDDDHLLRLLIREHLAHAGFRVLEAKDGKEAVERLGERIDLALLDLRLPDTHGLALIKRVKQQDPACQVITMTAHPSPETRLEAKKNNAYDYVVKPFPMDGLVELVSKAIERRRSHLEP